MKKMKLQVKYRNHTKIKIKLKINIIMIITSIQMMIQFLFKKVINKQQIFIKIQIKKNKLNLIFRILILSKNLIKIFLESSYYSNHKKLIICLANFNLKISMNLEIQ
jgi:hypothetical protein